MDFFLNSYQYKKAESKFKGKPFSFVITLARTPDKDALLFLLGKASTSLDSLNSEEDFPKFLSYLYSITEQKQGAIWNYTSEVEGDKPFDKFKSALAKDVEAFQGNEGTNSFHSYVDSINPKYAKVLTMLRADVPEANIRSELHLSKTRFFQIVKELKDLYDNFKAKDTSTLKEDTQPLSANYETIIHTPQFKNWFGDWEHPTIGMENFLNKEGKPKLWYHGSDKEISGGVMNTLGTGKSYKTGAFFTDDIRVASTYGKAESYFLSPGEKPVSVNWNKAFWNRGPCEWVTYDSDGEEVGIYEDRNMASFRIPDAGSLIDYPLILNRDGDLERDIGADTPNTTDSFAQVARSYRFTSLVIENVVDQKHFNEGAIFSNVAIIFNSRQIKRMDSNFNVNSRRVEESAQEPELNDNFWKWFEGSKVVDNLGTWNPNSPKMKERAFHGSPHKFDSFDISKVGTGLGAKELAYGLYFALEGDYAQQFSKIPNRETGYIYTVDIEENLEIVEWKEPTFIPKYKGVFSPILEKWGIDPNLNGVWGSKFFNKIESLYYKIMGSFLDGKTSQMEAKKKASKLFKEAGIDGIISHGERVANYSKPVDIIVLFDDKGITIHHKEKQ